MPKDRQYIGQKFILSEIDHCYGENVHILSDPYLLSVLAQFGSPETAQPILNKLIDDLYVHLLHAVVNTTFPRKKVRIDTRMREFTSKGVFEGEIIDSETPVICVDLARAGTCPSQTCFMSLNYLLNPARVRLDHYYINRKVNRFGEVIGVDVSGAKIGGPKENAIVLFPDPMGATGSSTSRAVSHYKSLVKGDAQSFIAMHLVITPEYIRRMKRDHPDVKIFAIRLDRGLSSSKVLASTPGKYWEEEKGLNEVQYVVPGCGGVGEILSNSFV